VVNIPENVLKFISDKDVTKIMVTASKDAAPHAIVAGSIGAASSDTLIIGEILMKRASKNLKENSKASFLFVKGLEAYSVDVKVCKRLDCGAELDAMNAALAAMNLKASAVWTMSVEAVYDQSANPNAGKKIA